MTAREQIIETMADALMTWTGEGDVSLATHLLDAIPPALLWDWLIETGHIEQVSPSAFARGGFVFRLVPE